MSCGCEAIVEAATKATECECSAEKGHCQRHSCDKNAHMKKLCRTRPDYFALWESGRGPCFNTIRERRDSRVGLGDVVAWLIYRVTFGGLKPWPGCGCAARKAWLNKITVWGWWR